MSQYPLRLPDSLMEAVRRTAGKENTSMNQLLVTAVAEKISALETEDMLKERSGRADDEAYLKVLDKVPDIEPAENDGIE